MRILLIILLLCSTAYGQRSILVGGTARSQAQISAIGFTRNNLELEWTGEQGDADLTEFWDGASAAYKFQAVEADVDFTAYQIITSQHRFGTHAMEVNIDKTQPTGDRWRTEWPWFSPDIPSTIRRIYGYSLKLKTGFETDDHLLEVMNIHAQDDDSEDFPGEAGKISAVGLYLVDGNYDLNIAWNNAQPTPGHAGDHHQDLGAISGDIGVWVDWVFDVSFNPAGGGYVIVYKNSEIIYRYDGPVGYNDINGCYFKIGLHRPGYPTAWDAGMASTQTMYYDDVRIGNELASYDDVAPGEGTIVKNHFAPLLNLAKNQKPVGNHKVDWIEHTYLPSRKNLSKNFI